MPADSVQDIPAKSPSTNRWFWCIWLLVFGLAATAETIRFLSAAESPAGIMLWLTYWSIESTLPFVFLLVLPVIVFFGRVRRPAPVSDRQPKRWVLAILMHMALIFVASLACSVKIALTQVQLPYRKMEVHFVDLPPAYHDEYSYLLQARTFSDGHLSYGPATQRPDLFHQYHVLNERRTVSRYFPWTGLWIAPFDAVDRPVLGHWLAGAFAAVFFYLALLQMTNWRCALAGGLLIAVSPGLAIFSHLLLAHHPTMLALSIFTCAFVRMLRTNSLFFALISGIGLTAAMLGRPMTAAGFALPFGVVWLQQVIRSQQVRTIWGFAIPLVGGFTFLAILNHDATGSCTRTAYQQYTDTYTPSHRYGFHNKRAEDAAATPAFMHAYNDWATNLTLSVAAHNVWNRLFYSLQWSLAIFPVLFLALVAVWQSIRKPELRWLTLLAASIVSLHIVHIPYWYDGIMHWHYVFETAPLLLCLAGVGMVVTFDTLRHRLSRSVSMLWVIGFVAVGLMPGWFELAVFDHTSKVSAAISELSFSRTRIHYFREIMASDGVHKPALILVDERNSDPQLSYIINPPQLDSDVLVCRHPDTFEEIDELRSAFPNRWLYVLAPETMQLTPLK